MLDADGVRELEGVLWEVVFSWREILQDAWPRDTGLSFSEWTSRVSGFTLEITNPVDYAEFVHPPGESEGASGVFMQEALDRLLANVRGRVLRIVIESEQRASTGFAVPARLVGAPQQMGDGLAAAQTRAVQRRGGRERQVQMFGSPIGNPQPRTVLAQLGGVLVRFRQRLRQRSR